MVAIECTNHFAEKLVVQDSYPEYQGYQEEAGGEVEEQREL